MTTYNFQTISQADASNFQSDDYLVFSGNGSTRSSATGVSITLQDNTEDGSSSFIVSFGGQTLTFPSALAAASQNTTGGMHIIFDDHSQLLLGSDSASIADNLTLASTSTTGPASVVYAFGGDDTINLGTDGNGYIYGGLGVDEIGSANANGSYHIYGNAPGTQGEDDGGDTIIVGGGTNYINGNAGDDTITVGTDAVSGGAAASTNGNRVFGGADNDTITIHGAGRNSVNGNAGLDTIDASSATGDNTLRGGQGDDIIFAGQGHDIVSGDIGNDVLHVSGAFGHITNLTGGAGADTFDFSAAGAGTGSTFGGTGGAGVTYYQEITDFTVGEDHISLANNPLEGGVGYADTTFANVHDAEIYASGQLSGISGKQYSVVSLSVGSETYLFYADKNSIDPTSGNVNGLGIIHLDGVADSHSITNTSFQAIVG